MTQWERLKSYFKRGKMPTEAQFSELIDSVAAIAATSNAVKLGSSVVKYVIADSLPDTLCLPHSGQVSAIWKRIALRNGQVDTDVRFLTESVGCIVVDSTSLSGFSEGDVFEVIYDFYLI